MKTKAHIYSIIFSVKQLFCLLLVVKILGLFTSCFPDQTELKEEIQQKPANLAIGDQIPDSEDTNIPEHVILKLSHEFRSIYQRIHVASMLADYRGLGPMNLNTLESFDKAVESFAQGECQETTQLLNFYLNGLQLIDDRKYMDSQLMLAKCYEKGTQELKAFRAYLRFLNSSLKQNVPDHEKFTLAIKSSIILLRSLKIESMFENFASGLSSANISLDLYNQIIPLIATESANLGHFQTVHNLTISLERKNAPSLSKELKAKIAYIRAIALMRAGNLRLAKEFFEFVMTQNLNDEITHHAAISLARIHASNDSFDDALKYYDSISPQSSYQESAQFEKIGLYIKYGHFSQARSEASLFLSAHPDTERTYKLRLNMIYLDINSKNYDQAEHNIEELKTRLLNLKKLVSKSSQNLANLSFEELTKLKSLSYGIVERPEFIENILKVRTKLVASRRSLLEQQTSLRDIYEKLAISQSNTLNTQYTNRAYSLAYLGDQLIEKGSDLALVHEELLGPFATPLDKARLKVSRENFATFLEGGESLTTVYKMELPRIQLQKRLEHSRALLSKILETESIIKGSYNLAHLAKSSETTKSRIKLLSTSLTKLKWDLRKHQDEIRTETLKILLQSGHLEELERKLSKRIYFLNERYESLESIASHVAHPPLSIRPDSFRKPWSTWRQASAELLKSLKSLRQSVDSRARSLYRDLKNLESQIDAISFQIDGQEKSLIATVTQNTELAFEALSKSIDEKLLKHQRWLAEIQWNKLHEKKANFEDSAVRYEIESEILKAQMHYEYVKHGRVF